MKILLIKYPRKISEYTVQNIIISASELNTVSSDFNQSFKELTSFNN